jgi:hypothetical protein
LYAEETSAHFAASSLFPLPSIIMNKLLHFLLFLPILGSTTPAFCQSIQVKQVRVSESTQLPLSIYLYPSQGVTLSYSRANQTVETVWLNNRRFIGLDSDGCLQGIQPSCTKNEATTLHLTLIDSVKGRKVDRPNRSLMTVVTVDPQGKRYHYLYHLQPSLSAAEGDGTALIEYVTGNSIPSAISATQIARGMEMARLSGRLRDAQLVNRTTQLLELLNRGVPLASAAKQAGVSMDYLRALANFGEK